MCLIIFFLVSLLLASCSASNINYTLGRDCNLACAKESRACDEFYNNLLSTQISACIFAIRSIFSNAIIIGVNHILNNSLAGGCLLSTDSHNSSVYFQVNAANISCSGSNPISSTWNRACACSLTGIALTFPPSTVPTTLMPMAPRSTTPQNMATSPPTKMVQYFLISVPLIDY